MKNTILSSFLLVIVLCWTGPALGQFNYPNFDDTTGLTLNRDAHVTTPDFSPVVRLVSEGATYGGGSMFYNDPMNLSAFSTSFCFRIGERGGITDGLNPDSGADGIAFLIQPFGPDYVAHTGGGQGYEGADPSLAIEFDCWDNGSAYSEPSRSHVGVMVDGVIDHSYALQTADVGDMIIGGHPEIDSGVFWHATVDYSGGVLSVRMIHNPPHGDMLYLISVPVDIPAILGQDSAYVGFTGGTGLAWANHDICSWAFVPEPATLCLIGLGALGILLRPRR